MYTLVVSPGIRDVLSAVILKTNVGSVKVGPATDTEHRQSSANIGNMARQRLDLLFTIMLLHPTKLNKHFLPIIEGIHHLRPHPWPSH
jgi:hypothetical protein